MLVRRINLLVLPLVFALWGCQTHRDRPRSETTGSPIRGARRTIRGAGASLPAPLYREWGRRYYSKAHVRLRYRAVGSSAGIEALERGRIDFGASDMGLSPEELESSGVIQFPVVVGAVVTVVNLPGVGPGDLVLDAETLAGIYSGRITRWNDPGIGALNPSLRLPAAEIVPIHQRTGSGTSHLFSAYLSSHVPSWEAVARLESESLWPVGVEAHDNEQAARFVERFPYTIAYLGYAHALTAGVAWTRLRTSDGRSIPPSDEAIERAVRGATFRSHQDLRLIFPNQNQGGSWPIVGASYALLERRPSSVARLERTVAFFRWALSHGVEQCRRYHYAPIPRALLPRIEALWRHGIPRDELADGREHGASGGERGPDAGVGSGAPGASPVGSETRGVGSGASPVGSETRGEGSGASPVGSETRGEGSGASPDGSETRGEGSGASPDGSAATSGPRPGATTRAEAGEGVRGGTVADEEPVHASEAGAPRRFYGASPGSGGEGRSER